MRLALLIRRAGFLNESGGCEHAHRGARHIAGHAGRVVGENLQLLVREEPGFHRRTARRLADVGAVDCFVVGFVGDRLQQRKIRRARIKVADFAQQAHRVQVVDEEALRPVRGMEKRHQHAAQRADASGAARRTAIFRCGTVGPGPPHGRVIGRSRCENGDCVGRVAFRGESFHATCGTKKWRASMPVGVGDKVTIL